MHMRDIIDLVNLNERAHRVAMETGEVTIFENPSPEQLQIAVADGPVKALLAPHDRLYMWSAPFTHGDVVDALSLDKIAVIDLDLLPNGPAISRGFSRHYAARASEVVSHSAAIHRLYGGHPSIQTPR
jgi:hypothetical protein